MLRTGRSHGTTAGPHATRRSPRNARRRVWRHVLPEPIRQQAKAEPEATGQCRRTWQTRFQVGVARPGARDPRGFAAGRGVPATSGIRGAPASWPSTAQPSMHNCRRRLPPLLRGRSGSKSHVQGTGSAQARAGYPPQGACCRSSARKTPASGHRRARGDASLVCGRKRLGHKGSALSVPAFSRRPYCGRMPGLRQAWAASPPLPFPALSASPSFARTTVRHDLWSVLMERTAGSDEKRGAAAPLVCSSCQRAMIRSSQTRPAS